MSCTNSEVMLTTKVDTITVTLSRVWLVWNERDNCSFQIKRSDEQTVSVCYFEGEAVALFHQTVSDLRDEPANYLREIASRQKDSQQMITKRIIGRWLHKRGLKVVAREPNAYTMTGSKGRINFWICQNGFVGAQLYSTVCAVVDHSNDIAGFTNLVKQLGEQ